MIATDVTMYAARLVPPALAGASSLGWPGGIAALLAPARLASHPIELPIPLHIAADLLGSRPTRERRHGTWRAPPER